MASRTLVSGLPRSLPPLPPGPAPTCVPCVEGRQRAASHSSEFPMTEAPLQTLHMDVSGPARVSGQGHERYFLLVVNDYSSYTTIFPLRRKGEVTEELIDWIRGARRQLSESFGSDLPILRLHSNRGVRCASDQPSASCLLAGDHTYSTVDGEGWRCVCVPCLGMLSFGPRYFRGQAASRAVPCVFLGFPPDARGWQFYHPTSRRVLSSQDVTFDESVSYYRVSQIDPVELVEVAVDSGAARGAEPAGAGPGGAEPRFAESEGVEPRGAEPERVEPGGAESGGAKPGGAEPERAEFGGPPGVPSRREPLSPQRLREWYARRYSRAAGATDPAAGGASRARAAGGAVGPGAAGAAGPGGAGAGGTGAVGGPTGVVAAGGAGAAGPRGARTGGTGAAGAGGAAGVGAVGAGAVATGGAAGAGASGGTGAGGAAGVVAGDPGAEGTGAVSASRLQPASPLPRPSPYSGPTRGLTERLEPESCPASPKSRPASPESCPALLARAVCTGRRVPRQRPPPVPGTQSMTLRPSTAPLRVPLPSPLTSSLPDGPDPESDSLRAASPTITRFLATVVPDPSFESTSASAIVAELVDIVAACRLDYAASLVAESDSVSVCPPSVGGECALGTDVLEDRQEEFECFAVAVKRPPGSPPVFKARYVARGFSQRQGVDFFQTFSPTPKMTTLRVLLHIAAQRDYELHSLVFSTNFLQGSLHEEIWLRRPPGFTGKTLAALGFAPSTADPSLFLRTDTTLPPFYVLVYVNDSVFATANTEALSHVKSELQKRHTCTVLGPSALRLHVLLATVHSSDPHGVTIPRINAIDRARMNMEGTTTDCPILIHGKIQGAAVKIFIDGGARHILVKTATARKLQLAISRCLPEIGARLVYGTPLAIRDKVERVQVRYAGELCVYTGNARDDIGWARHFTGT
ncbi:unnamed protein product [Closterium sp. NIES-53]